MPKTTSFCAHNCARAAFHSAVVTERPLFARWNEFHVSFTPRDNSEGFCGQSGMTRFTLLVPLVAFCQLRGVAPALGPNGGDSITFRPRAPSSGIPSGASRHSDQLRLRAKGGKPFRMSWSGGSVTTCSVGLLILPTSIGGSGSIAIRNAMSTSRLNEDNCAVMFWHALESNSLRFELRCISIVLPRALSTATITTLSTRCPVAETSGFSRASM